MTEGAARAPHREYELKARLLEEVGAFRERLVRAGWAAGFRGRMEDRRLDSAEGSLEAGDQVLRLRRFLPAEGRPRAVLGWKGPARRARGFKLREEVEVEVEDAVRVRAIMARLGYAEVSLAIDRRVELFRKEDVTLRIEEYPRMDVLVEIEGPPDRVEARLPELGLARDAWRPEPLDAFVRAYERRTGRTARLRERPSGEGA